MKKLNVRYVFVILVIMGIIGGWYTIYINTLASKRSRDIKQTPIQRQAVPEAATNAVVK